MDVKDQSHPNPQPDLHHRKVELQSPHDLSYLQNNLAKSALAKLDLHFPPIPAQPKPAEFITLDGTANGKAQSQDREGSSQHAQPHSRTEPPEEEEDEMRARVRQLVSEFLTTTWQTAQSNLTLNGIDATSQPIPHTATLSNPPTMPHPADQTDVTQHPTPQVPEIEGQHFTYATFEPRLQHKLASLHGELERLTAEVSSLRRTAPKQHATSYTSLMDARLAADDRTHESSLEPDTSTLDPIKTKTTPRESWNEQVRDTYLRGVSQLGSLAGVGEQGAQNADVRNGPSLAETLGKAQRARVVALEME